jgi:hypothetical protein
MQIRHAIAKVLVPGVYREYQMLRKGSAVPRPMIRFLKNQGRNSLTGIEIGVFEGTNALNIIHELAMKKLVLIDPYQTYSEQGESVSSIHAKKLALTRLSRFRNVEFIKKTSDEAIKSVVDPLDFVYIDGNHEYQHVRKDIRNYYPQVKKGGVIGGHDYFLPSVMRAVNEFVQILGVPNFHVCYPDWWIVK